MACCLMAPSHYMNPSRLFISEVMWHLSGSNLTSSIHATILHNEFENYTFKINAKSPGRQWMNDIHTWRWHALQVSIMDWQLNISSFNPVCSQSIRIQYSEVLDITEQHAGPHYSPVIGQTSHTWYPRTQYFLWNHSNSLDPIRGIHFFTLFTNIYHGIVLQRSVNSSPLGQNDCHFAGDIFICIFVNEKFILIKITLKFVPKGPIDNSPALV